MPSTSRRAVLRKLGVLVGALGGCQDQPNGTRTGTPALTGTRTRTETRTPTGTASVTASPTETETTTETDSETPQRLDEHCEAIWNPVDRWRYGTPVASRPAVVDGVVYVGTHGGSLYAFDAADGTIQWRQDQQVTLDSQPIVEQGAVVVASYDGVTSYDAADGGHRWTVAPPGEVGEVESDVVVDGGRVFFSAQNQPGTHETTSVPRYHRLYALDVADGGTLWTVDLRAEGIAATNGTVYAAMGDGRLLAFDGAIGESRWETTVSETAPLSRPVVGEEVVYVTSDGNLATIAADDGGVRWRQDGRFHDEPVVVGDAVYCATRRTLVALDPATGRRRWRAATPTWYGEALGATPETVFVEIEYDDRVEVLGLDAEVGCRLGSYDVWANGVTRVDTSEDTLFFGGVGGDGDLYAVSRPTRRET